MKRGVWIALGVALLALIVFASLRGKGPEGEKVYVEPVQKRNIESIVSANGQIDPKVKVNISANIIGKIEKLYFIEGDMVKRGQPLVELERASFAAQRERMNAEVANRRIEVSRAQMHVRNAAQQLRRAQQLKAEGIQPQETYDRARLEYDNARSAVQGAQEGVRQAQAGLTQAREDVSRTTIVSPIDGKVVQVNAHEGEVVITGTMNNPGSVIAVVADLSQILVEADVAETEIVTVKPGQKAKIKVDAVPDKDYAGRVVEIGSSAATKANSSGIRYFTVKIALNDADERLRPGMTAQADIVAEAKVDVLAVPIQAVLERSPEWLSKKKTASEDEDTDEDEKRKYVLVFADGKVKAVEVATGISNATHVAITSGLKGTEKVVTGPFRVFKKLRPGDPVQIQKEDKKTEPKKSAGDEEKAE